MKIKIFTKVLVAKKNFWSQPTESIDAGFEEEINEWINQNPHIKINEVKQSQSGVIPTILISIWYE